MEKVKGSTEPRLSTPPLRKLTRRTSQGFAVCDWATQELGWKPLPWQRWALIHALELVDGQLRFQKVLILVARQNGKTELLAILILYWLTHGVALSISSSASLDTARESWLKACEIAEDHPDVFGKAKVRGANGLWALELPKFKTRYKIVPTNRRGGRGLSAGRVVVDELREHDDWDAVSAVESTTLAVPDSQVWYISNAGDHRSVVLARYRAMGLTGEDDSLGFFEWSAPDGCDIDDTEAWAMANPGLGYTITERALRSLMSQPPNIFRTENLCQSVANLNEAVSPDGWSTCFDPGTMDAHRSRVAVCFDVSLDMKHVSLIAAASLPDGRTRVETVCAWDSTTEALAELPDLLARIKPRTFGWYPSGPSAAIATDLKAIRNSVELTGSGVTAAAQELAELVAAGRIAHSGDEMMTAQILGVRKLSSGDGWKFSRRDGWADAAYATAGAVHLARAIPAPAKQFRFITAANR